MSESKRTPAVDVFDAEDGWTVVLDLPGCVKEDVELTIADGRLLVKAAPRRPDIPQGAQPQRREAAAAAFARTLPLDAALDSAASTARMDRGVLVVHVPRRRSETREFKVEVR